VQSPPKGLATLALLKTRLDEGKDHLGLFEPFIEDGVAHLPVDHFASADLQRFVDDRHGLLVPIETTNTLLGRLARRGGVRKEGGRYFRIPFEPNVDIVRQRDAIQDDLNRFAEEFRQFAVRSSTRIASNDDALGLLLTFLNENNVSLLLQENPETQPVGLSRAQTRLVARFITQECVNRENLRSLLEQVLEGLVLKSALLLQDLAAATQRFEDLLVFLDSRVLFSVIGLAGIPETLAARETISVLRDTGAIPVVFDVTLAEMRRVLGMLEDHLATAEGRLTLRPTPVVRHVLSSGQKPSDLRIAAASLERRVVDAGVTVRETPKRDRRYTLKEDTLAEELVDASGDVLQARVRHDVDCVAAVLTIRRGHRSRRVETARAVFASSSALVIRKVVGWYRTQGEGGIPPILNIRALASIAWLKRPAGAKSLKVHELLALCTAALRPSRETWQKFVDNLKSLRAEGSLSDEETVAIVASELAEPILAELEDEREPDAATIHEAIERVKASYREEGYRTAQDAIREAETEAHMAQETAQAAMSSQTATMNRLATISNSIARVASWCLGLVAVLLVIGSVVVALPGVFENTPVWLKPVAWICIVLAAILTIWSFWSGGTIVDLRSRFQRRLAASILSFLQPPRA